jgi:hypothetical protein
MSKLKNDLIPDGYDYLAVRCENAEINKSVQEYFFSVGYTWAGTGKEIEHETEEWVFISRYGTLSYASDYTLMPEDYDGTEKILDILNKSGNILRKINAKSNR